MKLTKSKQVEHVDFFRDSYQGKLALDQTANDQTESMMDHLDFGRSLKDRILTGKPHIEIQSFVEALLDVDREPRLSDLPQRVTEEMLKTSLSRYGRALKTSGASGAPTLESVLLRGNQGENVSEDFRQLQRRLSGMIAYKKDRLVRSIHHNKIPFEWNGASLEPSTPKMKWLFDRLTAGGHVLNDPEFQEYRAFYHYRELNRRLNGAVSQQFSRDPVNTAGVANAVYQCVLDYHRELAGSGAAPDGFSFYLNEIREHFRRYFPTKQKKQPNRKGRFESLKSRKNVEWYYSEEFLFSEVHKHIINQLVMGLIQYGKLTHYYLTGGVDESMLTSKGLSQIQTEEAFKKQILNAIAWAVSRLNYFYHYSSEDAAVLKAQEEHGVQGDILLDKSFRDAYVSGLNIDAGEEGRLREKLAGFFRLHDGSGGCDVKALLEEATVCTRELRHNLFHFKQGHYQELLPDVQENGLAESNRLYQQDMRSLQECFQEQLRSMTIAEYYPARLLQSVLCGDAVAFRLYAPQYPMMPSFRNVYEKGRNLYTSDGSKHKGLHWYPDTEAPVDKRLSMQAYKRLLQIMYQNCFLPAVSDDNSLITGFIDSTIEWNKSQPRRNDKEYRYEAMPSYSENPGRLSDYLYNLQRLQSDKENENEETSEDKNYYIDFVRDIFVRAFDHFLEARFKPYRETLQKPEKQQTEPEHILEELFRSDRPDRLHMRTELPSEPDRKLLALYPFLRLLDRPELNRLLHQLIRYRASGSVPDGKLSHQIEELITMVSFTVPRPTENAWFPQMAGERFGAFIEGDMRSGYTGLYYQEDKESFILHGAMAAVSQTGVMALYQDIFAGTEKVYRVCPADFEKHKRYEAVDPATGLKEIERIQTKRQELHRRLVKVKPQRRRDETPAAREQYRKLLADRDEYHTLLKELTVYNGNRRKLTFESLYQLYEIHVDLLSRFAGFAEDWERDMRFLLLALSKRGNLYMAEADAAGIFEKGNVVGKLTKKLQTKGDDALFCSLCWYGESSPPIYERLEVRNSAAHLNHITQVNRKGRQKSLMEEINRLRQLLAYDAKRQNAVTKVVQEVLQKHQMELRLKWSPGAKGFVVDRLASGKIEHLKNLKRDSIRVNAQEEWMVTALRRLLEYTR